MKEQNLIFTSNEFSCCLTFLDGKFVSTTSALSYMKQMKSVDKPKDYYIVSREEAWHFFQSRYSKVLMNKKITTIEELLYRAEEYRDRYED